MSFLLTFKVGLIKVTDAKSFASNVMENIDAFYKEIGRNIFRARDNKGFTQEQLASNVNLKRTSISNIEKGKQKILIHTLFEIASSLDVEPENLIPKLLSKPSDNTDSEMTNKYPESRKWVFSAINSTEINK